jgi:phosphoribosylanthranilate isomerase
MRSHSLASFFRIKYCGFQRAQDIVDALDAGANAIGLNFYPRSPRYVEPEAASEFSRIIEEHSRGQVLRVGVFVNPSLDELCEILDSCPLDIVQLHGDELPELVLDEKLVPPIIKAISWRGENVEDVEMVTSWVKQASRVQLAGFLVDAHDPVQRGGTGKTTRWDLLFPRPPVFEDVRIILAGGLRPENVAEAISIARPDAVDTASGIETSPGVKNADKMRAFAVEANRALESILSSK